MSRKKQAAAGAVDTVDAILAEALGDMEAMDRGSLHPDVRRNAAWERESHKHVKAHPRCEVCGEKLKIVNGRCNLEVHHRFPYHLYPEREMDPRYWHVLCRAPHDCHRLWGHFGDFKLFNPLLKECIAIWAFMVRMAKAMLKAANAERRTRAKGAGCHVH
jgi:hypothetical protein